MLLVETVDAWEKGWILLFTWNLTQLDDIAAGMQNGGRLVGVHFFNPVAKMQLIEIIGSADTDPLLNDACNSSRRLENQQNLGWAISIRDIFNTFEEFTFV